MTGSEVFRQAIGTIEASRIPYMLTGSLASAYWSVPRATQDIDLVIAPTRDQLAALERAFVSPAYYFDATAALEAFELGSLVNAVDLASGWKIDLIMRRTREFSRTEFDRRLRMPWDDIQLWIATPEDVLLSKLEWAKLGESARQLEDAAMLLRHRGGDLDRPYLEHWVRELQVSRQWNAARRLAEGVR